MLKIVTTVVLVAGAAVYGRGCWSLYRMGHPPPPWRLALYLLGLAAIAAALVSPIDALAEELFPMHMVQHLLLTMVAAPLVLLGNPLPVVLWGVPVKARRWLARPLRREATFRAALGTLTWLPTAWLLYVVDLWLWHLPKLYQLALEVAVPVREQNERRRRCPRGGRRSIDLTIWLRRVSRFGTDDRDTTEASTALGGADSMSTRPSRRDLEKVNRFTHLTEELCRWCPSAYLGMSSEHWLSTVATIERANVVDPPGDTYLIEVRYRYDVGGYDVGGFLHVGTTLGYGKRGTAWNTLNSWRATLASSVPGRRQQDQARHDQGDRPDEIKVDPAAAQEGDAHPFVHHDGDDARHYEHRERMDAHPGQRDLE
jgi:Cytochrome c oxidase caa3 assembly factor (Caa3_CtaG)